MPETPRPLKPLREFNYQLVATKLDGLYINVSRDLERQIQLGAVRGHRQHVRSLSVLMVMLRFAWNSYGAVRYITADTPPDPNRKPNYVIVIPPVNRQLLDLLFSLVYMLDDLISRSLAYQRAGWRDLVEERAAIKAEYGDDVEWEGFLESMDAQIDNMVNIFQITPEEQAKPGLVNYWGTPFKLTKRESKCRTFLQFLERSIYKDVSAHAQSHVRPGCRKYRLSSSLTSWVIPSLKTSERGQCNPYISNRCRGRRFSFSRLQPKSTPTSSWGIIRLSTTCG